MTLYLKQSSAATGEARPAIPVAERTALCLERALLAEDRPTRRRAVTDALAADPDVAGWALRAAESRLGRTINRVDEAADWWCGCLESELAASLVSENSQPPGGDVEWRLPALAAKLADGQRQRAEFDRRLEHEKLESLKELAYGASHEINNPLANIAARAQTLLYDELDPERRRKLLAIHRQAMRAHEMIADLMLFARPPRLERGRCDLHHVVKRVIEELREEAAQREIEIAFEPRCEAVQKSISAGANCPPAGSAVDHDSRPLPLPDDDSLAVIADATQLAVAVKTLLVNSIEAVGAGGHVWIRTDALEPPGAAPCVQVVVRDDGPGISPEVRRHMFDPFFSGREAGRGLGFGLSKCWRIVTDHGGQIVVNQPAGGGAELVLVLPRQSPSTPSPAQR